MNLSPKMVDCIQEMITKLLAEFENAYENYMQDVAAIFDGQEFVGYSELSQTGRTETLRKIWSAIKKKRPVTAGQSFLLSDHNGR